MSEDKVLLKRSQRNKIARALYTKKDMSLRAYVKSRKWDTKSMYSAMFKFCKMEMSDFRFIEQDLNIKL